MRWVMTPAYDPKPGGSYSAVSAASTAFDEGGGPLISLDLTIGTNTILGGKIDNLKVVRALLDAHAQLLGGLEREHLLERLGAVCHVDLALV